MKIKTAFGLLALFLSFPNLVHAEAYGLDSIIVERSAFEGDYLPTAYVLFMGEDFELSRHPSCVSVAVKNNKQVYCLSAQGAGVLVGTLDKTIGQKDEWELISVKWLDNVRVKHFKNAFGAQAALEVISSGF